MMGSVLKSVFAYQNSLGMQRLWEICTGISGCLFFITVASLHNDLQVNVYFE